MKQRGKIQSKLSGRQIPKAAYVLPSGFAICFPAIFAAMIGEPEGCIAGFFLFAGMLLCAMLAENRIVFEFRQEEYVALNGCGLKKRAVALDSIRALAVVAAAWNGPGYNRGLSYRDAAGKKRPYPQLLLYTDRDNVEWQDGDVCAYSGCAGDFILVGDNLDVFRSIVDGTKCNIYVDKAAAEGMTLPEGRVRELHANEG